jgi:sarcosine oxidase subunit gamma
MAEIARRAALADTGPEAVLDGGDVRVEALALMGHVLIQLPTSAGNTPPAAVALALGLPTAHNRATGDDPVLMRLAPRAWVAITPALEAAAPLATRMADALRDAGGHAVELSDGHQSLRVSGPAAAALIGQGCALDLDAAATPPGTATRTAIARMPAILHRVDRDEFLLHVDRSYAQQFWDWFGCGVRETAALAAVPGAAIR